MGSYQDPNRHSGRARNIRSGSVRRKNATLAVALSIVVLSVGGGLLAWSIEQGRAVPVPTATAPAPSPLPSTPATPEPEPEPPVTTDTIAVIADTGTDDVNGNDAASASFEAIGKSGADFGLNLGDLAYVDDPGVEKKYCNFVHEFAGSELPWAMIPGNHEGLEEKYGGPRGDMALFAELCGPVPSGIVGNYPYDYFFDREHVRIIMISPNVANPDGKLSYADGTSEQAQLGVWIEEAQAAGKFVIVGQHEPFLTVGEHRKTPDNQSTPELASFEIAMGVDVVIAGHDHNVSRSHLLSGKVTSQASPTIVDDDGDFTRGAGTVFVVLGTGGHEARAIEKGNPLWAMVSGTNSRDGVSYGFGEFVVSADSIEYVFHSVRGPVKPDSFTVTKR